MLLRLNLLLLNLKSNESAISGRVPQAVLTAREALSTHSNLMPIALTRT